MTPERVAELLGNPKVTEKIAELLDDPVLRGSVAGLLDDPAFTRKVALLLKSPQVREAVAEYVELAAVGVIALIGLGALSLAVMLYNTLLLRRMARESER